MNIKNLIGAIFSGIVLNIKKLLTYNRAKKAINREAYDKYIEEEISLLEEMYRNPLFAQLLDSAFWYDIKVERNKSKRENSILSDRERSIVNFYLIWKGETNEQRRRQM